MSQTIQGEAHLLMASMATGAGLMMIYDGLRVLRLLLPHSWTMIGIEDFLYWCMAGFTTFYLLYQEMDGTIRWYVIGCVLFTMIGYDRLFSRFFLKLLKKMGKWIKILVKRNRQSRKI